MPAVAPTPSSACRRAVKRSAGASSMGAAPHTSSRSRPRPVHHSSSWPAAAARRTNAWRSSRFFTAGRQGLWSFPDRETLPYDPFSPHPDIVSERLRTLAALPDLAQGIVVTTQAALLDRLPPRAFIAAHAFALTTGDRIDLPKLRKRLADSGYVQVTQVLSPGEFAVRGSVVDLFAAGAPQPFRLDLFDDQIESVRVFDPADQRSGARLAAVPLLPAREIPSSPEAIAEFRAAGASASKATRRKAASTARSRPARCRRASKPGCRSFSARPPASSTTCLRAA